MNWKVELDGIYSSIKLTTEKRILTPFKKQDGSIIKVDNDVYTSYRSAQIQLIKYLKRRKDEFNTALQDAKQLKQPKI